MDSVMLKKRDGRLDLIKGIAISLVVIGHILQFCYENYASSFLFNIIWTLQIPLFMVVSGYFAGGGISLSAISKKARYYLIPFFSCFVICELLIRKNYNIFASVKKLIFHLESSLWYLFVIFELGLVHMLSVTVTKKILKTDINKISALIVYTVFYGIFLLPFIVLAIIFGTTFLGSKYVLYYSLFYWIGFVWKVSTSIIECGSENLQNFANKLINIFTLIGFALYFIIIANVNTAETEDNLFGIIPRFTASVCGVFIVIKTVFSVYCENNLIAKFFTYIGKYTLEIYYIIHYLFIPYFTEIIWPISSPMGMFNITFSYFAVLSICAVGIWISKSSPYISTILFGKGRKTGGK